MINLTPPRKVKAWGDGPMRLEMCPETWHTRSDPCRWYHGRPKCVPSTGSSWLKSGGNRTPGKIKNRNPDFNLCFNTDLLEICNYRGWCSPMVRGDRGSISVRVITKLKIMVLDASLLNPQHYKVRFKGKWSNPEKGVAPPLYTSVF